jgi:Zn-finger nucleic acid-binding protein
MTERTGIEIDYCPQCRGIWLDRGELDKIIERNVQESPMQVAPPVLQAPQQQEYHHEARQAYQPDPRNHGFGHEEHRKHGHSDHHDQGYGRHYPHKKKSILGELFDF